MKIFQKVFLALMLLGATTQIYCMNPKTIAEKYGEIETQKFKILEKIEETQTLFNTANESFKKLKLTNNSKSDQLEKAGNKLANMTSSSTQFIKNIAEYKKFYNTQKSLISDKNINFKILKASYEKTTEIFDKKRISVATTLSHSSKTYRQVFESTDITDQQKSTRLKTIGIYISAAATVTAAAIYVYDLYTGTNHFVNGLNHISNFSSTAFSAASSAAYSTTKWFSNSPAAEWLSRRKDNILNSICSKWKPEWACS